MTIRNRKILFAVVAVIMLYAWWSQSQLTPAQQVEIDRISYNAQLERDRQRYQGVRHENWQKAYRQACVENPNLPCEK